MNKSCKKFWNDFDNDTMPGKYDNVKPPLSKKEKAERVKAVWKIMSKLCSPYFLSWHAEGEKNKKEAKKQKNIFKKNIKKEKKYVKKMSDIQINVFKKHFGKHIDYKKLQKCFELFANGKLAPRQMDAIAMWIYWLAFVEAAISLGIDKAIWKKLKLIITKGAIIDFARRPIKKRGGPNKKHIPDSEVRKIRDRIHKDKYRGLDKEIKKLAKDYVTLFNNLEEQPILVAVGDPLKSSLETLSGTLNDLSSQISTLGTPYARAGGPEFTGLKSGIPSVSVGSFFLTPPVAISEILTALLAPPPIDLGKLLKLFGEVFRLIISCKNKEAFAKFCDLLKELCKQIHDKQWGMLKITKCKVNCDKGKITFIITFYFDLNWAPDQTMGPFKFVINFSDFDSFANEIKKLKSK